MTILRGYHLDMVLSLGVILRDVDLCYRTEPSMDHSDGGNGQRERCPTMSEQFVGVLISRSCYMATTTPVPSNATLVADVPTDPAYRSFTRPGNAR